MTGEGRPVIGRSQRIGMVRRVPEARKPSAIVRSRWTPLVLGADSCCWATSGRSSSTPIDPALPASPTSGSSHDEGRAVTGSGACWRSCVWLTVPSRASTQTWTSEWLCTLSAPARYAEGRSRSPRRAMPQRRLCQGFKLELPPCRCMERVAASQSETSESLPDRPTKLHFDHLGKGTTGSLGVFDPLMEPEPQTKILESILPWAKHALPASILLSSPAGRTRPRSGPIPSPSPASPSVPWPYPACRSRQQHEHQGAGSRRHQQCRW